MGTRRKEILLLVLAVLMLGVAVWTFRPKPAPAPVATAAAPGAAKPSEGPAAGAKPGEQGGAKQEGATEEGAQEGSAAKGAPRNPFTAPGAPTASAAPSGKGAEPASGQPEAGAAGPPSAGEPTAAAQPEGQQKSAMTLTGILSGRPTMAILRQNDQRYFVKVGDVVGDGYRVEAISSQQVVLAGQQGKLILRMGGRQ